MTVELNTCAASLTFMMEYEVSLACSVHNFGSIWSPHSSLRKICQQYGSIVKAFHCLTYSM